MCRSIAWIASVAPVSLDEVGKPSRLTAAPKPVTQASTLHIHGDAQSHLIARRILKLSDEKKKPVIAFVEDVAASGGYILAISASEIYADPFSIVGSIGVVYSNFGFVEVMKKIGIERRLETAGKHKSLLDPFSEATDEDQKRLRGMLSGMHSKFKGFVKERRGPKLRQPDEVLFEGDFWLADQALEFGLIDGVGDARTVLRDKFGQNVIMPIISPFRGLFQLPGDLSLTNVIARLDDDILWRKHGL